MHYDDQDAILVDDQVRSRQHHGLTTSSGKVSDHQRESALSPRLFIPAKTGLTLRLTARWIWQMPRQLRLLVAYAAKTLLIFLVCEALYTYASVR
jgi:hypothetical protein